MDVVYPPKAPSGSDIFLSGGFGELRIGKLGNQDEYVEIDSDDSDAVPQIESGLRNDASAAGVSGVATGVRTGAKSMAGSSLAPREVAAVSSASSHGRREQHAARSQGSVGRSSRSIVVVRALPQSTAGVDVSPRDSDGSIPKVFNEETSKRSIPKELRTQMSVKSNGVRSVDLSKSLSRSGDRNDEDGIRSRERDAQTISKRKASDIEPSTSTTPSKRTKMHGNPSDSSDMLWKNNKAEESQPRGMSLSMRKEEPPSKRKEKFDGREEEGIEKTLRASEMAREKRHRKLVLGDETDDDMQDEPHSTANQKSDGKWKKVSEVKAAAEVSPKKDSYASGSAKTGAAGSVRQVFEKHRLPLAGENGVAPFRSAFPLHARKKVHPPVSGDNKLHAGARYAAHRDDGNTLFTWITCTKCKKIRKVNADVNLKRSTWCCEKNTRDPAYASCSAPQEQNGHRKAGEVPADELEVLPEREARIEGQVTLNQTKDMDKDNDIARRNMVWVKLQVDGKELYWPGLQVTKFSPAIQKKSEEFIEESKVVQPKVVQLFHPREGLDEFQIVKRSAVRPFHQTRLSYKDSSSHPDFLAAVTAADEFYAQPDTSMEGFSQLATGSNEGPKPNATDEDAGCHVEDMPHEEAESNELEFEDAEIPGDDPQGSQPQTDKEIETLEDGEVNQVPVEEGVDDLSPEAGSGSGSSDKKGDLSPEARNGSGLSDKRDDLQCSQSQTEKERGALEEEEVIQVPIEQGKVQNSPEARNDIGTIGESNDPQCAQSQADRERVELEDEEVLQGSVERKEDVILRNAGDMIKSGDKRDDPQCSPSQAYKVTAVPKIETPIEQGNDDVEERKRTKGSEASGLEELYGSGEKFVLDLEILPARRLISYDDTTKMLLFQDGAAISIDTDSLGKELSKSSTGRTLHECIHEVGKRTIREKFPKGAKSSNGLKFSALDPSDSFAKRLRDTWLREYWDEPMPEFLKTRFVAGCIMEERGESVNWAHDLSRTIRHELKEISAGIRESLSPDVLKLIVQLLEKHVDQAPLPTFKAVKGEEPMDIIEYDPYCQQCNNSGELLCCDGSDCRKTYHLKCLNPPLEEPPSGTFFCPGCSKEASKPPGVEVGSSSVVEYGVNLHGNDVSRQEPPGVAESTTLVGEMDSLKRPASVNSRTNLEVGIVTTEAAGELLSSKNDGKLCVSSADTCVRIDTNSGGITLLADNLTTGAAHQLPKSNAHGAAHTALKDINVVGDLCVSRMVADATVGKESQIGSTPRLVVDSLQTKKHVLSDDRQKMQGGPGNASVRIDLSTIRASPLDLRSNGLEELGGESSNVHVVSSPSSIPLTDNGAIQLVNRDERSGIRVESSVLCGFTGSELPEQRGNDSESELEEGEISPSERANASDKAADKSVSKLTDRSPPLITQDISSGVELPREEEEFPSSDDHNSICEGCEVGGELMYVTTPSLTSTPSSPLMLCDGKGCKVVYHKECLNPPLQTVPAGEWYCPGCEKGKVEKIWSVRKACSVVRGRTDTKSSDATGSGNFQGDQDDSEDEAQDVVPLDARLGSSSQRPDGEVAVNEPGKASGSCASIVNTNMKDDRVEYLVQWKSRSHAHDRWVSEKELEKIAPKELARFKKLLHEGQEKYDSEWAEPERVIQKRLTRVTRRRPDSSVGKEMISSIQNAEIEWFVKWKGLGYEHCTWEPADAGVLATPRGIELITEYDSWLNAAKQRASKESQEEAEKRVKLPIKDLDTQPEWMIRPELLPLQLEALNKLRRLWHSRMNGILVYEASQEKIVMTIMFFLSLVEDYRVVRPILVVVPKSLIQNWEHELYQWAPKLYIVNYASKTEDARGIIRRTEFSSFSEPFKPQIVLTTFEVINCDMDHLKKVEWEALIIDEGRRQRLQKSYQKSYRPFSQIKSTFRLLLLSEPLKSNVEELIQFVNFLVPRKSVFSHGDDTTQVTELQIRLTGRVLEYIPENRLTEYWVPVEMTPVQLDQYYNLLVRHYPTLSRNHRDHQIQEVVTKLRQSCNHPLLADPALNSTRTDLTFKEILDHHIEISGKMRLLHLMMPILKAANLRVLIFSQETKQLDILERYMTQSHGSDSYERVDSDLATKTKEAAIQRFNAEGSKRFVLLLKTGVHISFKNVQLLLLYDSDWNPANDMRALHKIHNEGEASSKPLPVLRLYTHLTVEESTLILFRDKQLPPSRANVNAKICQKLLTWGASKIFDRYDNNICPTGSSYRPKGAKFCPIAKLKQVVYNSEVVQKLLEALLCQEEGSKLEGDELLEAILVPRDEPASLFAESDHPINMIMGDSAEAFWASSLKWRHDDWQAKEVNMLGKGQRGKKRITYDEDAMATAVYTKAQFSEESERKRPRRRKASSEEAQEVVTGPSAQVSFPTDSISIQVYPALHSNIPDTEQLQGNTDASVLPRLEALGPAHGPVNHDHAFNRNASSDVVRDPPKSNIEMFWECLSTICTSLELPGPVIERVDALLKHFMQFQKNTRKARATFEIAAIELALVWLAAKQLNHTIDKMMCISKVEERLGTKFDNRLQLVGPLYNRVVELCASFEPPPAPPAVVPTTSQPLLVPEISPSGTFVQTHPARADFEPSSRNVSVQATEQPSCNLPENPLAGSLETGQAVEAEVPSPIVPSSAPLSVQVTMPTDDARAVEESHIAHTVDEPVVEADTEVVLVGADPRLVPEEALHTFIGQSRFNVTDPDGRLVSGASMVEQGKGWVLVDPIPDVLVEEQVPVLDVATPAFNSSSIARSVGDFPSYGEWLQRGREAVSATLGASLPEVPGIPTSELPVESTSSPLTETQVPSTQNIEPAIQNEQAATDTPARLKERSHQDMSVIIRGQLKESAVSKSQADQKLEELKRRYDVSRRQPTPDPSVVKGREALYNSQKKTQERLNQADFNALKARQRADRDKLRDLYNKLTLSANGEGASLDVRKIELEIQGIKDYYSKFSQPSLTPSPLQGSSLNQRPALRTMPPTRPSPATTGASPTSTVQADGGSRVAQSIASANRTEDQQRLHAGRSSSPAVPVATSGQQQRGHSVLSNSPQRGHSVQSVIGEGLSNSQRPATEVVSTAAMQHTGVQPRGQPQRSNAPVHPGLAPNLQRGPAVVSRSLRTPALVPAVSPGVGHMARPSAPTSVTAPAGNATGHVYPDVLLKEKEKLNKDLEKAKIAYDSESKRIKAEYDKEAEILHKRYEALLVEQHSSFTKRQQQVQQNIMKVEWNRQLAEALQLREELAARAAVFAGLSSQTSVLPFANQQAPQQIPGRPQSGGTAAAPVPVNISRVTTNAGNAGPGISGVTIQPPGTSSTRVSTAPVQHSPRYGMPAGPQQESPRYGMPGGPQQESSRYRMPAAPQQESPRYGMPAAPQQESPRHGMPIAPRNDQPRSSMSGAMAVLAASGNAGIPGNNISPGISRAQLESVFTPSPEPTNLDVGAGSPRQRTSGSSLPGLVAPMPPSPFQDPILSIIRNSVPSLDSVVVSQENPVVVPPVSPGETSSMGIPAVGMGGLSNPQSSGPPNPLPAGIESQIPRSSEARPDHQLDSGLHSDELHIIEGVEVLLSSDHVSSGTQEQPVANVGTQEQPVENVGTQVQPVANVGTQEQPVENVGTQEQLAANVGTQEQPVANVAASSRPPSLIYLSDTDDE